MLHRGCVWVEHRVTTTTTTPCVTQTNGPGIGEWFIVQKLDTDTDITHEWLIRGDKRPDVLVDGVPQTFAIHTPTQFEVHVGEHDVADKPGVASQNGSRGYRAVTRVHWSVTLERESPILIRHQQMLQNGTEGLHVLTPHGQARAIRRERRAWTSPGWSIGWISSDLA